MLTKSARHKQILFFFLSQQTDESMNAEGEQHVSVIETATGKVISGEEAPLSSQLEAWMEANPG